MNNHLWEIALSRVPVVQGLDKRTLRGNYWSGSAGVQSVEILARFEADGLAGSDVHFGARSRVSADSGLAGANAEDAETAQFDAVTRRESLLEALENGVHGSFRFGAGQPRALNDVMDDILFDQSVSPS